MTDNIKYGGVCSKHILQLIPCRLCKDIPETDKAPEGLPFGIIDPDYARVFYSSQNRCLAIWLHLCYAWVIYTLS